MGARTTTSIAVALLVAAALSACGSSTTVTTDASHPGGGTGTGDVVTTESDTTSTPTTTTSTEMGTGSTVTGSPAGGETPACTAPMLKLAYLGGQGATGHGLLGFSFTNTSTHRCHTFGYPGVQFLDRHGAALPTIPTRTTHDFFGTAPEVKLLVKPGQTVSFRLGVTHGAASTAGCTTAYALQAIPPDDTRTLRTEIGNDGAFECRTATVSPLRPGTTAYP
jgi:hypothetical protein